MAGSRVEEAGAQHRPYTDDGAEDKRPQGSEECESARSLCLSTEVAIVAASHKVAGDT